MSRPEINLFVSYAHKDNDDESVDQFLEDLNEHFKASRRYTYKFWVDNDILIGEDWHESIQKALEKSDFGLLLLSLPFINSQYINKHELPELLEGGKALPVGFSQFALDGYDLKGLRASQIFRHKNTFYDRVNGADRKDFIEALFQQIEKRIDKNRQNLSKTSQSRVKQQTDEYDTWLSYTLTLKGSSLEIEDDEGEIRKTKQNKKNFAKPENVDIQSIADTLFGSEKAFRQLLNSIQGTTETDRLHIRIMTDDAQLAILPWQDLPHPLTGKKIIQTGGMVECGSIMKRYKEGFLKTTIQSPLLVIPTDSSHQIPYDSHFQLVHEYLHNYLGIIPGMIQRATSPENIKQELKLHEPDLIYLYGTVEGNQIRLDVDYMGEQTVTLNQLGEWIGECQLNPIVIINIRDSVLLDYPATLVTNSRLVWLQQARKRINIKRLDERLEKLFESLSGDDDLTKRISFHMLNSPLDLPGYLWINSRSLRLSTKNEYITQSGQLRAALLRVMLGRAELKKNIGGDILNSKHLNNRAMLSYVATGMASSCPFDVPAQIRHFLEFRDSEHSLQVLPYWFHLHPFETDDEFDIYGAIDQVFSESFLNSSGEVNTVLRKVLKKRGMEHADCCIALNWMIRLPDEQIDNLDVWVKQWQEVLCDNFSDEVPQRTVLVAALCIEVGTSENLQKVHTTINKTLRSSQNCNIRRINNRRPLGGLEAEEISDFLIEQHHWRQKLDIDNHDIDPDEYADWIVEQTDGAFEATVTQIWQEYRQGYTNYLDS
ncbi:MAG: Unknown protein [uncultured Thiotrichaceae bacterium]|uniref:TIR domain-containing protein n=1 Tax=uncultured Thiotrichaceae bacterium TaxID=298394 RepID=A0A6S6SCG5_9GAMM|nr:MAG: Unknown protein [uncultured Thiotrichaceae bacterium]